MDWEKLVGYLIGRVVQQGRRRAAEMREVAETALGLTPSMAAATAERQDWLAEAVARCSRCIESCGSRQRPSHKDAAIIPLRNRSTIGTKAWLPH
jgi:uncharacterized protein DUF1932